MNAFVNVESSDFSSHLRSQRGCPVGHVTTSQTPSPNLKKIRRSPPASNITVGNKNFCFNHRLRPKTTQIIEYIYIFIRQSSIQYTTLLRTSILVHKKFLVVWKVIAHAQVITFYHWTCALNKAPLQRGYDMSFCFIGLWCRKSQACIAPSYR